MILGSLMSLGTQDNKHLVPFHARPCLYFAKIDQILFKFLQDACSQLPVRHLATAKPDRGFHFIAALQPLARVLHTIVVIMIVRARPKLHFLDGNCYLLLLCLIRLLLGFVLKLSEVNDSANRRIGGGSDLHKIQTFFAGGANRVSNIEYAELFTLLADDSYLGNTNSLVNAGNGQSPVIRTLAATSKACSYISPPKVRVLKSQVNKSTWDLGLGTWDVVSQRTQLDELARHLNKVVSRHHADVTL